MSPRRAAEEAATEPEAAESEFDGNVHEEAPGDYAAWRDTTPEEHAAASLASKGPDQVAVRYPYANWIGVGARFAPVNGGVALLDPSEVEAAVALGGVVE